MDNFEKYILKKLVDSLHYNASTHSFSASMRPLNLSTREAIHAEGQARGMNCKEVELAIDRVQHNFPQWSVATERNVDNRAIDLRQLPHGAQINLTALDKALNAVINISLLHLGCSTGRPRLLVLQSSRLSLLPGDEVEPHTDAYLTVDHALTLDVWREGRRWPDAERVFHVSHITSLARLQPSPICEVTETALSFSWAEEQALSGGAEGALSFSFGKNPMSLLLHRHSRLLPLYADFDSSGQQATYTVGNLSAFTPEAAHLLFAESDCDRLNSKTPTAQGTFHYIETAHALTFQS